MHAPVEAAPDQRGRRVAERVGVNDVNDGDCDGSAVRRDGGEKGTQPVRVDFDVRVEEYQCLEEWGGGG